MSLYVLMKEGKVITPAKEFNSTNIQKDFIALHRDPTTAPKKLDGPVKLGALTVMPAVVDTPEYNEETQVLVGRYREIQEEQVRYFYEAVEKPEDTGEEDELMES